MTKEKVVLSKKTRQQLSKIVEASVYGDFIQRSNGIDLNEIVPNKQDLINKIIEDVYLREFTQRELTQVVDFYSKFATRLPFVADNCMDYVSFYLELNKFEVDAKIKQSGVVIPK